MTRNMLSIGKVAQYLGISIDTLRRWDKGGKLVARRMPSGHRYYLMEDIENLFGEDLSKSAKKWVMDATIEPPSDYYCQLSEVFRGRLPKLNKALLEDSRFTDNASAITAIVGEIGNNSFDHNFGNWPDISGLWFGFNIGSRKIVLADRGRGVLKTLQVVRPSLHNHKDALSIAFTEVVSSRAPESRGNGLKLVISFCLKFGVDLSFYSGNGLAIVDSKAKSVDFIEQDEYYNGCLAVIEL